MQMDTPEESKSYLCQHIPPNFCTQDCEYTDGKSNSGVAAITLKTLSAALEDNDHIECIIRETGLNQDGATAGLTMPSATAQKALIRATYAKAGLDIDSPAGRPQYFEAHGTGTPAGGRIDSSNYSLHS